MSPSAVWDVEGYLAVWPQIVDDPLLTKVFMSMATLSTGKLAYREVQKDMNIQMTTAKHHNDQRVKPAETSKVTSMSKDRWRPTAVKGLPEHSDSIQTSWRPALKASRDVLSAAHSLLSSWRQSLWSRDLPCPRGSHDGDHRRHKGHDRYVRAAWPSSFWLRNVDGLCRGTGISRCYQPTRLFPLTAGFGSVVPPLSPMQSTTNVAAPWWPRTLTGTRATPHPVVKEATETLPPVSCRLTTDQSVAFASCRIRCQMLQYRPPPPVIHQAASTQTAITSWNQDQNQGKEVVWLQTLMATNSSRTPVGWNNFQAR